LENSFEKIIYEAQQLLVMNPEIDLNQLVDEFLRLEKYVEESKEYESIVAARPLSANELLLEQDWQRFVTYKFNQAGVHQGLQDAVRDGYLLILEKLTQLAQEVASSPNGFGKER
jgi:hypothetical protein